MPFIEIEKTKNSKLKDEITVTTLGRIYLASNLMQYFPSGTLRAFIDIKNKKIGLQDSGPINIRYSYCGSNLIVVNIAEFKKYKIKRQRYPIKWSDKHRMVIAKIEFSSD